MTILIRSFSGKLALSVAFVASVLAAVKSALQIYLLPALHDVTHPLHDSAGWEDCPLKGVVDDITRQDPRV